ncbi:adenosine receptor A3-like [Anneissia japonica]|uniref:adenosine receptor A3-like n=1 Tax=Anneissia japonica TaxID=1529436 RepID=UPI0014259C1E|nr:adenosine receptor A3-like [Anneissia japonica]
MVNNTDTAPICVFPKMLSIPFAVITLCVIIGNIFVIFSVYRIPSLRKPCYLILASMAVLDILTGFIGIFVVLRLALRGRFFYFGDTVGWLIQKLSVSGVGFSLFHHMFLAGERYFAIMYPYVYNVKVHTRSVVIFLIVVWTVALLVMAVLLSPLYNEDVYNEVSYIGTIFVAIPMYACHLRIYCKAKKISRQVASSTSQAIQARKSDFKAALVTSIILGVFSICTLPLTIHNIVAQEESRRCSLLFYVFFLLVYMTSMLNPIVILLIFIYLFIYFLCIAIGYKRNIFVIVSVYNIRSLQKPCYIILASMAILDLLTGENFLELNAKKTKEVIVDFRRKNKTNHENIVIDNERVEIVEKHKYLGLIIDNELNWESNTKEIRTKHQCTTFNYSQHSVCPRRKSSV